MKIFILVLLSKQMKFLQKSKRYLSSFILEPVYTVKFRKKNEFLSICVGRLVDFGGRKAPFLVIWSRMLSKNFILKLFKEENNFYVFWHQRKTKSWINFLLMTLVFLENGNFFFNKIGKIYVWFGCWTRQICVKNCIYNKFCSI